MINLPIFRAKKLDSGEYVKGFLYQDLICYIPSDGFKSDEYKKAVDTETWFIMDNLSNTSMIDISTLSIHFPNMLAKDSDRYNSSGEKDLRVFASLQEDGKGGDICESKWFNTDVRLTVETESVRYSNSTMIQDGYNISRYEYKKIIGIQQ